MHGRHMNADPSRVSGLCHSYSPFTDVSLGHITALQGNVISIYRGGTETQASASSSEVLLLTSPLDRQRAEPGDQQVRHAQVRERASEAAGAGWGLGRGRGSVLWTGARWEGSLRTARSLDFSREAGNLDF